MTRYLPLPMIALAAALAAVPAPFVAPSAGAAQPKKKGTSYAFMVAGARYTNLQAIEGEETINDILEFKKALLETGFDEANIVVMHDRQAEKGGAGARFLPEHEKILKELDLFLDGMKPDDTVLLVLSGHGVLFKGEKTGYFCPVDAKLDPKAKLIPMDGDGSIYAQLEKCKAGRKLLISNTCRDAPSVALRDDLFGKKIELADDYPEAVPKGIAAIYSCEAGQRSYYDAKRGRSLFFIHLTDAWRGKYHAGDGPLTLEAVFDSTRVKTKADANATKGAKQFPVVRRQYDGEWAIRVVQVPPGEKAEEFEYVIEGEKKKGKPRVLTVDLGGGETMDFVRIEPGTFQMGAPDGEKEASDEEKPQRKVEITKGFYLGKFEVTQGQYKAITGDTPSKFKGDRLPVETVSWDDAVEFCEAMSKKVKRAAALPSEAQWEYACRAGTTTPFHFGSKLNGDLANCNGNYPYGTDVKGAYKEKTVAVGSYPANPWGLHDMHGNAWEWCRDYYGGYDKVQGAKDPVQLTKQSIDSRVLRGGSWIYVAGFCRAAYRRNVAPDFRTFNFGFRVCLPLD